ncbi:MAG TPA: hypothetical protein VM900_04270 [Sphingomonas sp.]|jgi:hypothetical protein|nr:hypothetical protein [Sphingomonas sp.]
MRSPLYVVVATVAASHGAVAPGAEAGEGLHLVTMAGLDVPIVEGDRADGRLRIKIVLRAADEAGAARLQAALPALREASLATTSEFARLHASPFSPVDARRLAADLQATLHGRADAVRSVLLVEVAATRA